MLAAASAKAKGRDGAATTKRAAADAIAIDLSASLRGHGQLRASVVDMLEKGRLLPLRVKRKCRKKKCAKNGIGKNSLDRNVFGGLNVYCVLWLVVLSVLYCCC